MAKKVLMGSVLLILSAAVLASVVKKRPILQERNANTYRKIELFNQLNQQDRYYERYLSRRTAVIDVPDATVSRRKSTSDDMLRRQNAIETAIPIVDNNSNDMIQTGNTAPLNKVLSPGNTIATTNSKYATAYYGRNIAMGSDGNVHAVWSDEGTPSNTVYYAKSMDKGKTWSTPVVINDGYYGYKPTIDVHPNDPTKIHVAYVGYMNSGETRTIRYVKSEDGGDNWSSSVLIAGSQVDTNNPDIIVDSQGNPHVAFDSYVDDFIRYNYSSNGGTSWMTEPEIVNTGFGDVIFGAAIAIDNDDNPHVLFGGGGETWGNKDVYWNWRDMASGEWQEIPPVQLSSDGIGSPYPSMVFDSNGIGHCFYDAAGTTVGRSVWYRQYDPDVGWGDAVEFPTSKAGGYTIMPQAGIDDNDNLYVGYFDGLGGEINLEPSEGDFFVGTNISGEWQYTNISDNGPTVYESHPNAARHVSSSDSLFHCLISVGNSAPYNVVYEVGYPWPPNPKCDVNQLSDTYETTGPFKVTASTSDLDGTVDVCSLFVFVNGIAAGSCSALSTAPDVWEAKFTITGEVGDKVSYIAKAIDNDGLEGESFLTLFDILEPENPGADILLVGDDIQLPDMYTKVLDELGYAYEYWNANEHVGIDESVTNYGWNNIIVGGWAISYVPTRDYTDNPFAAFLDNGGNIAIMSMDWFWGAGETEVSLTFNPGDFAYDYFQIGRGENDPGECVGLDSMVIGTEGDPISGNWSTEPMELNVGYWTEQVNGLNCIDWTTATGNGVDCFYAFNEGHGTGVHYDGGTYKTVFLPFMYSWLIDSTAAGPVANVDAIQLMDNILTWFGALSPPILSDVTGPRYGVYGYGPFDVSVEFDDLNKASTVENIRVGYKINDAADYTWLDLTADNGTYTGQLPQLTPADTAVSYKFKAVDDDGLAGMSDIYQFWTTGLSYTPDEDLLYCGDDYYSWYYTDPQYSAWERGPIDSMVTDVLDDLGVSYDYWDVDYYGPPDYQTVLSNYDHVIWHGYAEGDPSVWPFYSEDNPFYPYLMGGGHLLWSSEEMLGVLYDEDGDGIYPEDILPASGESAYDILNTAYIGPDWAYDTLRVRDLQEPINVGMDSVLTMEELPFGFMGDLADAMNPVVNETLDNTTYIFDAFLDDYGVWYSYYWGDSRFGIAWRYIDPTYSFRTITMPFCIANLDSVNRSKFLTNALAWFAHPTGVDQPEAGLPKTFALYHNRPNPFNPETIISYDLPQIAHVDLVVYNIMGQKIRTLFNGPRNAGRFDVVWDGKDDAGAQVASGVYIFQIVAGDFVQSHKMMLLR